MSTCQEPFSSPLKVSKIRCGRARTEAWVDDSQVCSCKCRSGNFLSIGYLHGIPRCCCEKSSVHVSCAPRESTEHAAFDQCW